MTDVEARTPNKRRLSEKKAPASAKKAKITPQKQENKGSNQNNVQNSNGKFKKGKKNSESENGSPKKLKPFAGTSKIAPSKEQKTEGNKKPQQQKNEKGEGKKARRSTFATIKEKLSSNEKDVALQSIEEKIKAIESRGELTKSAKKKLKLLYRLQKAAGGEGRPPQENTVQKSQQPKKGSDVAKAPQGNLGKKDQNKTPVKGQKANALNKKQVKVETKQITKKTKQVVQEEDSDEDEESDNELEEEEDSDDEVDEEVEGEDDDDGEEEEDDSAEEEEDSDESEEDSPPQVKKNESKEKKSAKLTEKAGNKETKGGTVQLDDLKNNKIVTKNQKRYVVFVGNIPYDTNKQDLAEHFKKCGEIKHVRIPTEKKSSKPRGFAYVEVGNDESYQKCLSMHHTLLKGRRINVLYTQGGKKKGEEKKKEIKAKNFKLHAMRREGKLAGSKKENQKRSFRRAKRKAQDNQGDSQE